MKQEYTKLEYKIEQMQKKLKELRSLSQKTAASRKGSTGGCGREKLKSQVEVVKLNVEKYSRELLLLSRMDPYYLQMVEDKMSGLENACEVIVDNIETVVSYFNHQGVSSSQFRKEFEIPDEFAEI